MTTVKIESCGDMVVIRVIGELDAYTVPDFRGQVAALPEGRLVLVDMEATTFVDSSGLGALIGLIRRIREQGGVVAVGAEGSVARVLRTAGFDRIALVSASAHEAAAALTDWPVDCPPPGDD